MREEDNYLHRYGAIGAGGVVGSVFALRRGMFRRLVYTATGASAAASVCYPDKAEEYSSEAYRQAKRYIVIAYHFVNGGKLIICNNYVISSVFNFSDFIIIYQGE